MPRLTVHLPDETAAIVRTSGDSISGRLVTILHRYARICTECRPRLPYQDWLHICEVANGVEALTEHAGLDLTATLASELRAAGYDETAARVMHLSLAERIAIVDVTERFWADREQSIADGLALLGIMPDDT